MWAGTGPRAIGINPEGWGRDLQILVWRGRDVAMIYDYILISYNVKKYEMKTLSKVVTSQTYIQIRVYQIKLSGDDTVNRVLLTSCCCTQRPRDFPVFKPGPTTLQIDASAPSEGVWVRSSCVFGPLEPHSVYRAHNCSCGARIDTKGSHGLSCSHGFGRIAWHSANNDVIHRSLSKAGISSENLQVHEIQ